MSQTRALFWKEWFEVRGLFAIGLFVFLGLPLIGAAEDLIARQRFDLSASLWVYLLGGVLAVVVGVGTAVRDLNGKLEEFWRSRPVSVPRWLMVKYFTGLAVVLVTLMAPAIVETAVNAKHEIGIDPRLILAWNPFFWAAVYSLSFAIACVVRRGAHAAMLSIALLLLLYFLPQVMPPLRFLSLAWVMDESQIPEADHSFHRLPWLPWPVLYRPRQLWFVVGMIAICAIALTIAVMAVRRDWRVESGRKTMYWSIGGAILILFASAAFQVGSNLSIVQTIDLSPFRSVGFIRGYGDRGVMRINEWHGLNEFNHAFLQTFQASATGVELGPEVEVDPHFNWWPMLANPEHPDIYYVPGSQELEKGSGNNFPILTTAVFKGAAVDQATQTFPELVVSNRGSEDQWWASDALVWHDRLYVLGAKLMTFDLTDPRKPRLLSAGKINWRSYDHSPQAWRFLRDRTQDVSSATLPLPPVPQLPARQRLELAIKTANGLLSGDILPRHYENHITTYRVTSLTEDSVTFVMAGRYEPTALDRLIGGSSWGTLTDGGLLFEVGGHGQLGGSHISVFDIAGSRPRPVAHFALPHESDLHAPYALPDGRLLVSGYRRIYLLSSPPGR